MYWKVYFEKDNKKLGTLIIYVSGVLIWSITYTTGHDTGPVTFSRA
jgi:hypothetical protein